MPLVFATDASRTAALLRAIRFTYGVLHPSAEPWLAGTTLDGTVVVYAYGHDDDFAIRPLGSRTRGRKSLVAYEVRTASALPETILVSATGRRATDLIDEPLVRALGGTIASASRNARGTILRIEADWPADPDIPIEHALELQRQFDRVLGLVPALADEIERALEHG